MEIQRKILEIYSKSDKRLGAGKVRICLTRDDCISIREGRVHRLMKEMNRPKMSTVKPPRPRNTEQESGACTNLLAQQFSRDTLRDAVKLRGVSKGVMFHTDRGSQFTSSDFRKEMDRLHMVQSFSAKGHPYDNAVMACFFKYLKKDELDRRHFQTIDQLKQRLLSYIAVFYNPVRPPSHNHGLSPDQRERQSFPNLLVHFIDMSPCPPAL